MNDDEVRMRLGVTHTIAQYVRFGDTGQFDEFAAQFAENGVLESFGLECNGPTQIRAFVSGVGSQFRDAVGFLPARHHVSSIHVEPIDGDHAKASSYFLLVSARGPDHWGRYADRFVRAGDRWLFEHRRIFLEGSVAGSPVADRVDGPRR